MGGILKGGECWGERNELLRMREEGDSSGENEGQGVRLKEGKDSGERDLCKVLIGGIGRSQEEMVFDAGVKEVFWKIENRAGSWGWWGHYW